MRHSGENVSKKKKLEYDPDWARAKKLCRLSAEDVRMAKELGFKPRTLIKNNPSPHQQWKPPVKFWIRELYEKRQRKQKAANPSAGRAEAAQEPVIEAAPLQIASGSDLDHIPFL